MVCNACGGENGTGSGSARLPGPGGVPAIAETGDAGSSSSECTEGVVAALMHASESAIAALKALAASRRELQAFAAATKEIATVCRGAADACKIAPEVSSAQLRYAQWAADLATAHTAAAEKKTAKMQALRQAFLEQCRAAADKVASAAIESTL